MEQQQQTSRVGSEISARVIHLCDGDGSTAAAAAAAASRIAVAAYYDRS